MGKVDIFSAIDIIGELARKEFKNHFSQFVWGKWWLFLFPVLIIGGISWAGKIALRITEPDFSLFLSLGFVFWFFFVNSIQDSSQYIISQRQLFLSLGPIELIYLPAVKIVTNLFVLIPQLAVLSCFFMVKHHSVVFFIHLCAVGTLFFIFTFGITYIVSGILILFRDVSYVLGYAFMLLFWMTPIFYPLSQIPAQYGFIYRMNPLTYFFDALYQGVFLDFPIGFLYPRLILIAVSVCCLGGILFFRGKKRLIKALIS
jgi:ABC-type polysaccharide/polyol phosphate export permease